MKKTMVAMVIMLLVVSLTISCVEASQVFEARQDIAVDYEWSVEFSKEILFESVTGRVSIVDMKNNEVDLDYRLDDSLKVVKIKPKTQLEYDSLYTLKIHKGIRSTDGATLRNSARLDFRTELRDVSILDLVSDREVYYVGEELKLNVKVKNEKFVNESLWLGCSLMDPLGNWVDIEPIELVVPLGDKNETIIRDTIGEWVTGQYEVRVSIWDKNPTNRDSSLIDQFNSKESIGIYRNKDSFEIWNEDFWTKRDGFIVQTRLNPENVILSDSGLRIRMPKNKLEGGEIRTRRNQGFGSYEVSMKLPNAPSSITGFFLYRAPDFHHEIDIEIFNQPDSQLWLTTYENGREVNNYKEPLWFDPTADYHRYRIDYYPDRVSFYIDGQHIQTWTEGFSMRPMRLMLNSWYPTWLDGIPPVRDEYLDVKWIKY